MPIFFFHSSLQDVPASTKDSPKTSVETKDKRTTSPKPALEIGRRTPVSFGGLRKYRIFLKTVETQPLLLTRSIFEPLEP